MNSTSRIRKIQALLKLGSKKESTQYMISLVVYKDRSFEESQKPPCGFNNSNCNGLMNAVQGKRFLGQFTYHDKPNVSALLKDLYDKTQKDILDKLEVGCALVWISLLEKENGELVIKL